VWRCPRLVGIIDEEALSKKGPPSSRMTAPLNRQ
jgi:hypothetical protein